MRPLTQTLFIGMILAVMATAGLTGCSSNEEKKDPIFETG